MVHGLHPERQSLVFGVTVDVVQLAVRLPSIPASPVNGAATSGPESERNPRMSVPCTHLDQIRDVTPKTPEGCEECLESGDTWVHLRLCLTCGHVGCCDSSKNKHATKHFHATGHPIVQSFERGEDWVWCYIDQVVMEPSS